MVQLRVITSLIRSINLTYAFYHVQSIFHACQIVYDQMLLS